ncbi:MAG: CBS domain-containing protein [Nitrososphaeraceae archaeon]
MTPNVITVNEKQTLREGSKFMYQHNIGGLIVLMDISSNESADVDKPIGIYYIMNIIFTSYFIIIIIRKITIKNE